MIKSSFLVVWVWTVLLVVSATATDSAPARFREAADHDDGFSHENKLRKGARTDFHHAVVPIEPAPGFLARPLAWLRRLVGLRDVWSMLSDTKQNELLHKAQDKLTALQQKEANNTTSSTSHRRLEKWKKDIKISTELGAMFKTLRFIANRIGEVNDKAYTAQEKEAARLAALGSRSSSSSSSMDADAQHAAAVEASRAKAAVAYGLATPSVPPPPPTSPPPHTLPPTRPVPTQPPSVFTRMQW